MQVKLELLVEIVYPNFIGKAIDERKTIMWGKTIWLWLALLTLPVATINPATTPSYTEQTIPAAGAADGMAAEQEAAGQGAGLTGTEATAEAADGIAAEQEGAGQGASLTGTEATAADLNAGESLPAAQPEAVSLAPVPTGELIVIDPGHQRRGNNSLEPDGPGSKALKPKVSSGTQGVSTKKPEYVLNLEVSLLLKEKLEARGFRVQMTRDSHDVDMSNMERAEMANEANADLMVRIHADGSDNPKAGGISVLYPAASHPEGEAVTVPSREAARIVLDKLLEATGAASRGAVARSDLSGFNWAKVPGILVEMGFMSNPAEDKRMSEADYQDSLAEGMAEGIAAFFTD
jgi:N-acetylmuramoyl-L-alanine amidase